MSTSIFRSKFILASALSLPASAFLLNIYLHDHPLSASKTRKISTSETLSPTAALSTSLRQIVNPRNHIGTADSRSIYLSKNEIGELGDEEILARFLKGFFGGWIFTPERGLIAGLKGVGRKFIPCGYKGIEPQGPTLSFLSDFSRTTLPPKHTLLWGGNFMVLDHWIAPPITSPLIKTPPQSSPSFLEIGFGDNRKKFAGLHRFEVSRDGGEGIGDGKEGGVTVSFSSISINPMVDKRPFPLWGFVFNTFYAQCLFRDGIREVLS